MTLNNSGEIGYVHDEEDQPENRPLSDGLSHCCAVSNGVHCSARVVVEQRDTPGNS